MPLAVIDEGYIKFNSHWIESAPLEDARIDDLIRWRRPLFAAGLIGHYAEPDVGYGNISARGERTGQFIISGTQTGQLAELDRRHFALVTACDIGQNTVESTGPVRASSESMTHAAIYELDARIGAVVHIHHEPMWTALKDRLPTTAETVAYGTPQMALEFARLYRETRFRDEGIAVMGGHPEGLIATGCDVADAAQRILALGAAFTG